MSDIFENVFDQRWMKNRTMQADPNLKRSEKNRMKF